MTFHNVELVSSSRKHTTLKLLVLKNQNTKMHEAKKNERQQRISQLQ
jgi:hypothetical protein